MGQGSFLQILTSKQNSLQNFLYFPTRENSKGYPDNFSAPSNEDKILAIIQIHQDS